MFICVNENCDFVSENPTTVCPKCGGEVMEQCMFCTNEATETAYVRDFQVRVCEDCLSKYFAVCEECGKVYFLGALGNHSEPHVCNECFSAKYVYCYHCNKMVKKSEAHTYRGRAFCEDCFNELFTVCNMCGELIRKGFEYTDPDGNALCVDCFTNNYFVDSLFGGTYPLSERSDKFETLLIAKVNEDNVCQCPLCGSLEKKENMISEPSLASELVCRSCSRHYHAPVRIWDYYHKPELRLYSTKDERGKTKLLFGTEMEFCHGDPYQITYDKCMGIFKEDPQNGEDIGEACVKHDGSIGDGGHEIVSQPHTLRSWRELYKNNTIQNLFNVYSEAGYKEGTRGISCGYHIHTSRAFYGETEDEQQETIAKTIVLVDRLWDDLWFPVTRRSASNLDRWAAPNYIPTDFVGKNFGSKVRGYGNANVASNICSMNHNYSSYHNNRYHRINLLNEHTVEFRIFKSTLNAKVYMATMELVDHLIRFAKLASSNDVWNVNLESFMMDCSMYPELLWYLDAIHVKLY